MLAVYFLITGGIITLTLNFLLGSTRYNSFSLLDGMIFSAIAGALKAHLSNQLFIVFKIEPEKDIAGVLFFIPKSRIISETSNISTKDSVQKKED